MITLTDISKKYNGKQILDHITLEIPVGQGTAFLGANGCGKSTLLKIIAGLVRPSGGKVCVEKGRLIHYVPEHFPKMNFTPLQYLQYMGRLDGMGDGEAYRIIREMAEDFRLESMLDIPMKHLSKGSLQKIGVVQALMKRPDILLLDEPLSGQDVRSQQAFIGKVRELEKDGVTVLMSCHEPFLVDALTPNAFRITNGKLDRITVEAVQMEQWYLLFFTGGAQGKVPEGLEGRLQYTECGCQLRMPEKECDRVISEMMKSGWNLRGMWNENNDKLPEI